MVKEKKLIKFPSIEQFRHVQKQINQTYAFTGMVDGEPTYDNTIPKPVVEAYGTVKLHGTNAGITWDGEDMWAQSKNNILTPTSDNMGFAFFVEARKDDFLFFFEILEEEFPSYDYYTIYGEFAGEGIQRGVAISEVPKGFYTIGVKGSKIVDDKLVGEWLKGPPIIQVEESNIYDLCEFTTYAVTIDFSRPDLAIEQMQKYVDEVENQCPVADSFGVKGIGEGIVWHFYFKGERYIFETKGEKHSKSRVKKLPAVDPALENKKREVVAQVTPSWRLEQGLNELFGPQWSSDDLDRSKLGDYIRWVMTDVVKEELDVLTENGFELNDLNKVISEVARNYFFAAEAGK